MTEYTSKSDNKHKEPEFDSTQKNNNNNNKTTTKENLIIYPELDVEVSPTIFGWMWKSLLPSLAGWYLDSWMGPTTLQSSLCKSRKTLSKILDPKDGAVMFHFNDTYSWQELDGHYKIHNIRMLVREVMRRFQPLLNMLGSNTPH